MFGAKPYLRTQTFWRLGFLYLLLLVSCQTRQPDFPVLSAQQWQDRYQKDTRSLDQLKSYNVELQRDFLSLQASGGWKARGYFTAQEMDRMEGLLFRYHVIHHQLLEIADRYAKVDDANRSSAVEHLHTLAHQQLLGQATFAVDTFSGDQLAIDRMNQRYPRSEIPSRTYDHLVDMLEPAVRQKMKSLGRKVEDDFSRSSYAVQAEVFYRVSRFKSPRAHLIRFTDAQKEDVLSRLQPGDLIVSYTAGYVSSFFIPGQFKHAMVYVGSVEDRRKIGLVGSRVDLPAGRASGRQVRKDFLVEKTMAGREGNMIESVAEGVKFSDLRYVMDTHINRLAVIRPQLTDRERVEYLSRVFSYLGQEYDFEFDFADASRQVCTEVVYRSLNDLGGIDFKLSKHAGRLAMTADDLVNYWINENPEAFEFVLYADESKLTPGHTARIRVGKSGERQLIKLMGR